MLKTSISTDSSISITKVVDSDVVDSVGGHNGDFDVIFQIIH